jgi:chromosome segregation ATPase
MAADDRLAKERATLYSGSLSGFTGARAERAKELRDAGDKELAAAVAKLPKPTVAAWAVDQVAHHYTEELEAFLAAGKAVRDAQAKLLRGRGSRDGLEAALGEERRQVRSLAELARGLLADAGQKPTQATLDKVRETLHAATLDEAIAVDVAAGGIEREQRASGLGAILAMPVKRQAKATGRKLAEPEERPAPEPDEPDEPDVDEEAERSAAAERRAALAAARAELSDARSEATERRKALRAAERAADQARDALREAEDRVEAAEDALNELREPG